MRAVAFVLSLALLLVPSLGRAADGDLDASFGGTGVVTVPVTDVQVDAGGMALPPDGGIVVAGRRAPNYGLDGSLVLARFTANGTPDATFGTGGQVTTVLSGLDPLGVAVHPDGSLYVLRVSGDILLSRFTSTGDLDPAFGTGGTVTTDCGGEEGFQFVAGDYLVAQPDGKLVVGVTRFNGSTNDACIVRYAANGALDPSFGTAGITVVPDFFVADLALQASGGILVAGGRYTTYPESDFAVARLGADGAIDVDFGTSGVATMDRPFGYDWAVGVASQPDGRVVAMSSDFFIVRFRSDGSLDPTFGDDGIATPVISGTADGYGAVDLVVQPDGKTVIGAIAVIDIGPPFQGIVDRVAAVRLSYDGALDPTYGSGGVAEPAVSGHATTLRLQPDGKAVVNASVLSSPLGTSWKVARLIGFSNPCASTPVLGCKAPVAAEATLFKLRSTTPVTKNQLQWKWKGDATAVAEFGDPAGGDDYALCLYDESGMTPALLSQALVAGGGICKGKPCWKPLGTTGVGYADGRRIAFGIGAIKLKAGMAGKASIQVKGQGGWLVPSNLPLDLPLRVQLVRAGGTCWEAVYSSAHAARNDGERFQGKSD